MRWFSKMPLPSLYFMRREDSHLNAKSFGNDFVWGVSTSAHQIEGAYNINDKGPSIWDEFSSRKGVIYNGQNAHTACDFYHRYPEDIALMKQMNIENFRFSIAWSRIIPEGFGSVSEDGVDFYQRLIDCCLESGITPWVTLYHWDLPQYLHEKGGWTNRDIVQWFIEYAFHCGRSFGDRVKNWMVLNEPMVFTGAGYFLGVHAPGNKGLKNFLPAIHHTVLCQAEGAKTLKKEVKEAHIGTTFSCSFISPDSKRKRDLLAAERADALLNRLFIEPVLGLGYPLDKIPALRRIEEFVQPGDMEKAQFDFDFIGIQNYTREIVKYSRYVPYIRAKIIQANQRNVPTTLMNWEVYPGSIYEMIAKFSAYKGVHKIIITENGAAFQDITHNGEVVDPKRLSYIQKYLQQVLRAKRDGFKVEGYFVWTFTDNFEWAEGYYPRFGLVHVDFGSQKRTIKSSGKWFSSFLASDH